MKIKSAVLTVLFLAFAGILSAQTLEEILSKHYTAVGGADKWASVNTLKTTGKMKMMGMEADMTIFKKRTNKMFVEIGIMGSSIKQGYNGTTAWQIDGVMGSGKPEVIEGEKASSLIRNSKMEGELFNTSENFSKIELAGQEDVDGINCFKISAVDKNEQNITYYLNAETMLIEKKTVENMQGETQGMSIKFEEYKDFEGIMLPVKSFQEMKLKQGKFKQELILNSVEFNIDVQDSIFEMPSK